VARTISVADDVFEWLKNEKGERSYSELLREFRDQGDLSELNGLGALEGVSEEEISEVIEEAGEESVKKIEEKFS
jgi:predicted CopG family antitoxin